MPEESAHLRRTSIALEAPAAMTLTDPEGGLVREVDRIVDQMMRVHVGSSWIGNAPLDHLLEGLSPDQAAARPIPEAHSIWEIILHLTTAQEFIVDLVCGTSRPFQPGDDWPSVGETTEAAWAETVERFRAGEVEVRRIASERMRDERLDEPFREGGSPAYNNLHGYIQHAAYHWGQISLLRKLAR